MRLVAQVCCAPTLEMMCDAHMAVSPRVRAWNVNIEYPSRSLSGMAGRKVIMKVERLGRQEEEDGSERFVPCLLRPAFSADPGEVRSTCEIILPVFCPYLVSVCEIGGGDAPALAGR